MGVIYARKPGVKVKKIGIFVDFSSGFTCKSKKTTFYNVSYNMIFIFLDKLMNDKYEKMYYPLQGLVQLFKIEGAK